jgi:hypothetical protein
MADQQAKAAEDAHYQQAISKFPSIKVVVNGEAILLNMDGSPLERSTPFYDRMHQEFPIFKLPVAPMTRRLFSKDTEAVPVPENLKDNMEAKAMTSTFNDCMKSNPAPNVNALPNEWHDFLSEFHAQWTAQRWPNSEASAMCLQAELGSHEKLQWTRGDNLQAYLETLSFNMGTQGSLRKRNRMANYAIDGGSRLSAHWGIFRRRAAEELMVKIPLTGTEEVRVLFVQRIYGSPYEKAWTNMLMYHQFAEGLTEANWKQAITIAQANHAAPQPPATIALNKLNPQGTEYKLATEKAKHPRKVGCPACNDTTHEDVDCPLIAKFGECFPRKFIPFSKQHEKRYYCPIHGHQNSHDGQECYTLTTMRENPSASKAQLQTKMQRRGESEKEKKSEKERSERKRKALTVNAASVSPPKRRKKSSSKEELDYSSEGESGSDSGRDFSSKRDRFKKKSLKKSLNCQGSK